MNVSSLWHKESCGRKSRYGGLDSKMGKAFANGMMLKELFVTKALSFTPKDIEDIVDQTVDPKLFQTERELNLNGQVLAQKLMRMKDAISRKSGTIQGGGTVMLDIYGEEYEGNYHFLRINDKAKTVVVYYVKNKKKNLTDRGRIEQNRISKNMELYILQKIGENLFPSYKSYGAVVFLSNQFDSASNISSKFDERSQIVMWHHSDDIPDMEDRLSKLVGLSDDHFSCKSDCNSCAYHNVCSYTERDPLPLVSTTVSKASGSVTFTPAQEEFIDFEKGVARVLAGAGSGKTTCVANRIIELLDKGYFPEEILLVTYTTKGVEELKEKISFWLHVNFMEEDFPMERFQVYTFNGFGFEVIKKEYKRLGFTDVPQVLDKYENMKIIKKLLDDHPEIDGLNYVHPFMSYMNSKGAVLKMDEYFKTIKSEGIVYPEELEEVCRIPVSTATQILMLYKEYEKFCKSNNFIDFDDQVQMLNDLFTDHTMIETYGFSHIMVDEYQDSDNLQTAILKQLMTYHAFKSLVVVGDDSQAIYSWRGATSENIIKFATIFPHVQDIEMVENFRSTKQIIRLANHLNDINTRKVPKDLIAEKSGDNVVLLNGSSIEDLADVIVKDLKGKSCNLSEIALISRNKKELLTAQSVLTANGIPTILATSELLIDNTKVQMLTDFAGFLIDMNQELGFAEYCKLTDYEEFCKNESSNLEKYLKEKKEELLETLAKTPPYQFFISLLETLGKEDKAIARLLEVLRDKRLKTIYEISEFLSNMETFQADYFVEKIEDRVNAVTLTTAHSSKGREWKKVYVYLNRFKYPKTYNIWVPEKNTFAVEEERRLLFVAVTRAKESLTILGDKYSEIYKEVASAKRR